MPNYFVIAWRPVGEEALFFRGDHRYEIFLPYVANELLLNAYIRGWVRCVEYARVFDAEPKLTDRSFAKGFARERVRIFPYQGELLKTQLLLPTKRPQW